MAIAYDPFSPAFREDPYPTYRALREQAPVHWAEETGVFCLSRYDDVVSVLRQPGVFSSEAMRTVMMPRGLAKASLAEKVGGIVRFLWKARLSPFRRGLPRNLITEDPPRHDAMRAVVNRGFTPRRIEGWRQRAEDIVKHQMERLRDGEPFDVVEDLAVPLPVTLIAEMLGVPPERQHDFKRWSDAIIRQATGSGRDEGFPREMLETIAELYRFLRDVVRERRRRPTDDLIGIIVTAQEADDAVLSDAEVLQFVLLLLVAGNETTTNLIGNAVSALLAHPEVLAGMQGDASAIPDLVEETLRWDSPIQYVFRTATCDTEIAGVAVARGQVVCPILAAANRDERRFPDGERFRPGRETRGHLGFGLGVHFCLGASLARLEATAALTALVPELPRLRPVDEGPPPLVDSFLVRGPSRLALAPAA